MFYSHTVLGRKGPLGTVWCAAHLQHRLRKTHYIATDISSTVERIMYPEVPIALRLSGHLLLGVVRIYSKKVDYLRQDCDVVLIGVRRDFHSSEVNLPEGATCAPMESITLPKRFELDSFNFEDESCYEGYQDVHLRNEEEITLPDQIPVETNPYVTISLSEDLSHSDDVLDPGPEPMDEDISPRPVDSNAVVQDPGPTNSTHILEKDQTETNNQQHSGDDSLQDVAEFEHQRDAVHDNGMENLGALLNGGDVIMEPATSVEHSSTGKDIVSPSTGGTPMHREHTLPSQQLPDLPSADIFDSHNSFEPVSPELQIRPSPELQVHPTPELRIRPTPELQANPIPELRVLASQPAEKRNVRGRKRKFDAKTVLSNGFIKKAIDDPSDLRRARRMRPSSALDVWKFENIFRKEITFLEPLTTGACADLQNIFKKDFISSKAHLARVEDEVPEKTEHSLLPVPDIAPSTLNEGRSVDSPEPVPEVAPSTVNEPRVPELNSPVPEFELMRDVENTGFRNDIASAVLFPSPNKVDISPNTANSLGATTVDHGGIFTTETMPSPYQGPSAGPSGNDLEIPSSFLEVRMGPDNTGFSANLNLMDYAEAEDLDFLEADNSTPTGSGGTPEVHTLSARTRAVAQYLKGRSPIIKSPGQHSKLSLKEILEGKTRKLCARMFYETLVLKSYGLVGVEQEGEFSDFGDIKLTLTPMLSNEQF